VRCRFSSIRTIFLKKYNVGSVAYQVAYRIRRREKGWPPVVRAKAASVRPEPSSCRTSLQYPLALEIVGRDRYSLALSIIRLIIKYVNLFIIKYVESDSKIMLTKNNISAGTTTVQNTLDHLSEHRRPLLISSGANGRMSAPHSHNDSGDLILECSAFYVQFLMRETVQKRNGTWRRQEAYT